MDNTTLVQTLRKTLDNTSIGDLVNEGVTTLRLKKMPDGAIECDIFRAGEKGAIGTIPLKVTPPALLDEPVTTGIQPITVAELAQVIQQGAQMVASTQPSVVTVDGEQGEQAQACVDILQNSDATYEEKKVAEEQLAAILSKAQELQPLQTSEAASAAEHQEPAADVEARGGGVEETES